MEANASKTSHIPRPSRLPVPRTPGLHPSTSKDFLRESTTSGLSIPRLRATPSRDQLVSTPARNSSARTIRDRDTPATSSLSYTPSKGPRARPSNDALFRHAVGRSPSYQQDLPVRTETYELHSSAENVDRSRKSRPSLSERTMETIAQLPPPPAVRRRTSSFFNAESPMRPPSRSTGSRPGSSSQSDASAMPPPLRSASSRPTSSSGSMGESIAPTGFHTSINSVRASQFQDQTIFSSNTPVKNASTIRSLRTPSRVKSSVNLRSGGPSNLPSPGFSTEGSPSPVKSIPHPPIIKSGSRTIAPRQLKPRASVGALFRKPSMPDFDISSDGLGSKKTSPISNTSSENNGTTSRASKDSATSFESIDNAALATKKSSMALRDQIAKAKAAKRAQMERKSSTNLTAGLAKEVSILPSDSFDFGLVQDPFNQGPADGNGNFGLLKKRVESARTDGRLNIAAMSLKEIPSEVMNMYNLESIDSGSWAESVDLTRFVAADNELSSIGEDVFPDVDPREMIDDEDYQGNQFGGLETLDLHGNLLQALPMGLRRLEMLTTLNLSNNALFNDCFEVISYVSALRDLKLANNTLSGQLPNSLTKLTNLEVIDVRQNSLNALPENLAELMRLRILNISGNQFNSLPFDTFQRLPLTELLASKNKLDGMLVKTDEEIEMPKLQVLEIGANALTSIGRIRLPSAHQFTCSANRLTELPDMSSWASLLTLTAEDNSIDSLPVGFVTLSKLKNCDLSGNNIRVLDDRICLMTNLDTFRVGGNPLRERKFSAMNTEDLKRALKGRLVPEVDEKAHVQEESRDAPQDSPKSNDSFNTATSTPTSPSAANWPVKAGGVLDRSNTQSYSLNPVVAARISNANSIKTLDLHHNVFKEIPSSIAFFAATLTTLSLAHNELTSDTFLQDDLELPVLKELNLSSNTFDSLQPLIQRLHAPQLLKLDISFNRLTSLPALRNHFPNLTVIMASNNTIKELSPEAVKGLKILDCSSNDLNSLNARIGLLGGPGGLEKLDVTGNRFRVPKYTILEKGTEATLAWLRDRIPAGELVTPEE